LPAIDQRGVRVSDSNDTLDQMGCSIDEDSGDFRFENRGIRHLVYWDIHFGESVLCYGHGLAFNAASEKKLFVTLFMPIFSGQSLESRKIFEITS